MSVNLNNYFDGQFQNAPTQGRESPDQKIALFSPADLNIKVWENQVCFAHVENILNSAQHGFEMWRKSALSDRKKLLDNYLNFLTEKKEELAKTLTLENGQPFAVNLVEVELVLRQSPELLKLFEQELTSQKDRHFQARGPALLIGSFIRPIYFTQRFLLANLFCGNSLIFKPSEKVGLTVQKMVECLNQVHFPTGTINLIHGQRDGEISRRLLKDRRLKVIFFTGTNEVGYPLYDLASSDLERSLSFSLARKNVCLLEKGFDQKKVLPELQQAAYSLTGQDCLKTSVAFIHKNDKDAFIDLFHEESKKLSINHPDQNPFMGPLIDQRAMDNYILHMGMAKREGFEEIMRGKHLERNQKGHYVTPSIHSSDSFIEKSRFLQSDLLGPNLTFITYSDLDEAINMSNRLEFPSLVSLYSSDPATVARCQEKLETSLLLVNRPTHSAIEHLGLTTQVFNLCHRAVDIVK